MVYADWNAESLKKTTEKLRVLNFGESAGQISLLIDVSKEADVATLVKKCVDEFGSIDVMFANAGVR